MKTRPGDPASYRRYAIAATVMAAVTAGMCSSQAGDDSPFKFKTPPPANYYRMKKATLMDEHGFAQPIPALTLLIPTDWQFRGNVQWGRFSGCTARIVQATFSATSADGRLGISLYSPYYWQYASAPMYRNSLQASNQQRMQVGGKPCDIMPPMRVADFLRQYAVPKLRPGTQLIAIEPAPELTKVAEQAARTNETQAAAAGNPMKSTMEAARAHLKFNQNGQPMEEWLAAIVWTNVRTMPSYGGSNPPNQIYDCGAYYMYSVRTPQGELASREKFFQMITGSVQFDTGWNNRVNGVTNNISAIDRKGAHDRQVIQAETQKEIARIRKEGYDYQQKVQESSAYSYDQYIRGVETYKNPATGETVELSSQYGHAWANRTNEYILTDQPNFDPNVALKDGNWTRLEPVKH